LLKLEEELQAELDVAGAAGADDGVGSFDVGRGAREAEVAFSQELFDRTDREDRVIEDVEHFAAEEDCSTHQRVSSAPLRSTETFVEKGSLQAGFECSGGDQNADLCQGDVAKIVGHAPSLPGNQAPNEVGASMREALRGVNSEESALSVD
jgi:hypothetical protein